MKHIPTFENFQENGSNSFVNEAEDKKDWEKEVSELSDRMVLRLVEILNNSTDNFSAKDALLAAAVWEKRKRKL
jgi:hypothetical protein